RPSPGPWQSSATRARSSRSSPQRSPERSRSCTEARSAATVRRCSVSSAMLSACEPEIRSWYVPARMEAPDGELIRVIAERGREAKTAAAELCRRFGPRIRLYGLRHLRDEERAKDLVQAVLVA